MIFKIASHLHIFGHGDSKTLWLIGELQQIGWLTGFIKPSSAQRFKICKDGLQDAVKIISST
ncbi:MAG: hypothetical protein JTJ11_04515, partial [Collinsella sp.]|nr:hypothetical protein [Collinsella sp.]